MTTAAIAVDTATTINIQFIKVKLEFIFDHHCLCQHRLHQHFNEKSVTKSKNNKKNDYDRHQHNRCKQHFHTITTSDNIKFIKVKLEFFDHHCLCQHRRHQHFHEKSVTKYKK